MWLFKRSAAKQCSAPEMALMPPVELSKEEHRECQAFVRSIIDTQEAQLGDRHEFIIKKDIADEFQRSLISLCLMGRAERFLIVGENEEACHAAAKACAIYPVSINFYDLGRILRSVGEHKDARLAFAEFLRRFELPPSEVMETFLKSRDVAAAVEDARKELSK